MSEVLLIGEPMGLFSASEEGSLKEASHFNKSIAGAELNVGIGLARLNHTVAYISKVGNDPIGTYILERIQKEKIDSQHISVSSTHQTGLMFKNRVTDGDPKTAYYRKCSAFTTLSVEDVNAIDMSKVKLLHVTGIPPAVSETTREAIIFLMKKAKETGIFVTFDPNLRPALWASEEEMVRVLNDLAALADVVLPGIAEGKQLMGSDNVEDIAKFYLDRGAQVVITKSGEHGAYVSQKGKETINVKGFKVSKVVDTVGAGDGFAVGIIHAYLNGYDWEKAGMYANAIGSLQVQHAGDNEGLPSSVELERYVQSTKS